MRISHSISHEDIRGFQFGYRRFGKPKMWVYLYYVDGLLIDSGQRHMQIDILDITKGLSIDTMFITHHHEDHSGNIAAIHKQQQCRVLGSTLCSELMASPPPLSYVQKLTWGNREGFEGMEPVGDTLKTAKFTFKVIPIPGHAPDMVALYEPEREWLFSADLYVNYYLGYFLNSESVLTQIESIKKVLLLNFKVMFCSHNPQLNNPKEKLQRKLDFLESNYTAVGNLYQKGLTPREIFHALKWKENQFVKILSGGLLSKANMITNIIRDIETTNRLNT